MSISRRRSLAALAKRSVLAVSLSLAGCGSGIVPGVVPNATPITGNWQFSSTDTSASRLPSLSGQLTGSSAQVTGVFHSKSATACVSPTTVIALSGSASANNLVTLTGTLAGGTLTISGTLSADGRTLTAATYDVTGGTCAFSAPAEATTAQSYSPVTGTYAGNFTDIDGHMTTFTIELTQALTPNASGNFPLSGNSILSNNSCFSGLINISDALVTGDSFMLTYASASQGNSVVVNGNLSSDASTLTVTDWVLTGPCNSTSGTGTLIRQ